MENLFIFLLIALISAYSSKPVSKSKIWIYAVLIPLISLILYGFIVFLIKSSYYAGSEITMSIIPAIISGIVIYFQLKKKIENNNQVKFPIILFIFIILSLIGAGIHYSIESKNKKFIKEYSKQNEIFNLNSYSSQPQEDNSTNNSDFKPSFKESHLNGNTIEHIDSLSLIYSNFIYGFSMDFPDNWSLDRGVSEHTIIRGRQIDSLITFAINIVEVSDIIQSGVSIWDLWEDKSKGFEEESRNELQKSANLDTYNYNTRKVYVSNIEAFETKFNYIMRQVDLEIEMQAIFYHIFKTPLTYAVGFHIPKIFYDDNPERYNYFISKFVLMKPNSQRLRKIENNIKYD